MKIQDVMDTPNPDAKRFVLDMVVVPVFQHVHASHNNMSDHALAKALLAVKGVSEVYLQGSWVTVTRESDTSWDVLARQVAEVLRGYQPDGVGDDKGNTPEIQLPDDPRMSLIKLVIDQEVMPYLNSHGGSLELVSLDEDVLKVRYQGACSGCPASVTGTLLGIEALLQREVDPELTVEAM